MASIITGFINLIATSIKYGFYSVTLGTAGVSGYLVYTKPTNESLNKFINDSIIDKIQDENSGNTSFMGKMATAAMTKVGKK